MKKTSILLVLLLASLTLSQSFDCAKATTDAEKAICADSTLSALDSELAQRYFTLLKEDPEYKKGYIQDQRNWLKIRDWMFKKGKGAQAYEERIEALEKTLTLLEKLPHFNRKEPYFSGTYILPHTISVYENQEWVPMESSDEFVFYWVSDDTVHFALETYTTNGHACFFRGTAVLDRASQKYVCHARQSYDNSICSATISLVDDTISLEFDRESDCSGYCGARAYLYDISLSKKQRSSRIVNTDLTRGR